MDFNFYYSQRHASSDGVTTDQSAKDSAQVLATYNTMFDAVHNGNRAPMILGNRFEAWNNNAYTNASATSSWPNADSRTSNASRSGTSSPG